MVLETVDTAGAAFVAGLVTSIHCVGMCGPLSCSLAGLHQSQRTRQLTAAAYHGGRVISYLLIGSVAGALGYIPLAALANSPAALLPWFLIAALLITGFGLGKKIPLPAPLLRWVARVRLRTSKMSAARGGLTLGLITPMLPCGPLYIMFGIALVSGSRWLWRTRSLTSPARMIAKSSGSLAFSSSRNSCTGHRPSFDA